MVFNLLSFSEVMQTVGGIVLAVAILLAMVTVHEFGHYVAGKILGFKITEFSVGFGPALFKKRSKRTGEIFALRIVPLGGYCAFDGEDYEEEKQQPAPEPFEETAEEPAERVATQEEYPEPKGEKFNDQPPWKRIIVLVAGAVMNYLLAMVLLIIMVGSYGVPKCMVMPSDYQDGMDVPHAAWETPTLESRDILLELNGKKIGLITDCISALKGKKAGEEVSATVLRLKSEAEGWQEKTVTLTLLYDAAFDSMAETAAMEATLTAATATETMAVEATTETAEITITDINGK